MKIDRLSLCEFFANGYKNAEGPEVYIAKSIPDKGRHIVQVGGYMAIPSSNIITDSWQDLGKKECNLAYALGEKAAKMLKYNKRKSIRLGMVLDMDFIFKDRGDGGLSDPLELLPRTFGWRAILDVSPEARRTEV
jgi:hypothetical protein